MKHRSLFGLSLVLLLVFWLSGCDSIKISASSLSNVPSAAPAADAVRAAVPAEYSVSDYFPFVPNRTVVYRGIGNEYAAYTAYPDYIFDNRIQMRSNNGGTETIKIIEISDGKLALILSKDEVYYKTNYLDAYTSEGEILLQEPLIAGTSWQEGGSTRSITGVDVPVTTPYGDFSALEVTTVYADSITRDYYAPNTGLIKTEFESGGNLISSELEKIIFNNAYAFSPVIYSPKTNDTDIAITSHTEQIHLFTNEDITSYFEQFFIGQNMMSKNTRINSLRPADISGAAHIDFSQQFITEMNAGSSAEAAILQSVANTVGAYFQTDRVIITLDGENYASGHFEMADGEWFDTDF